MAYNVMQEDITMLGAKIKHLYIKMELLSEDDKIIAAMEGALVSGSITIDVNSSSRRIANPVVFLKDDRYMLGENRFIWFNRYVRISLGVKTSRMTDYKWYPLGKFLFNENTFQYDSETKSLSLSLVDLMETLATTPIGGAYETVIPADGSTTIREAMISTVSQLGCVDKYIISKLGSYSETDEPADELIPFDLEFSAGSYVYDIISKLRDLYSGYETFFDVDGTFICQPVPTGIGDPVILSDDIISTYGLVIGETLTNKFSDIKNVTEVWGTNLESDRYSEQCFYSGNTYFVAINNCKAIDANAIVGVKINATNTIANTKLIVQGMLDGVTTTIYDDYIYTMDNKYISANTLLANTAYCFRYQNGRMYLLGQHQVHAITMLFAEEPSATVKQQYATKYNCNTISYLVNPDSPFGVDKIGVRLQVFSGGEYDDIYSDDLARQRAEYENWKASAFQDTLQLQMVLIPWLDVNQKISYRTKSTNELGQYIVTGIDFSFTDGTMNVSLRKFYPLYPFSQ